MFKVVNGLCLYPRKSCIPEHQMSISKKHRCHISCRDCCYKSGCKQTCTCVYICVRVGGEGGGCKANYLCPPAGALPVHPMQALKLYTLHLFCCSGLSSIFWRILWNYFKLSWRLLRWVCVIFFAWSSHKALCGSRRLLHWYCIAAQSHVVTLALSGTMLESSMSTQDPQKDLVKMHTHSLTTCSNN